MSVEASTWAWRQTLTVAPKLVLLCLADHADDEGNCFPSLKRLELKTGLGQRTVVRAIRTLRDGGQIVVIKKKTTGLWDRNIYQLQLGDPYTPKRPIGVEAKAACRVGSLRPIEPSVLTTSTNTPPSPLFELQPLEPPAPAPPARRRCAPVRDEPSEEFLEFWELYPRHEAMKPAWKAWQKIRTPDLPKILAAVTTARKKRWNGCEKHHIPLAATWLNGERWDDHL